MITNLAEKEKTVRQHRLQPNVAAARGEGKLMSTQPVYKTGQTPVVVQSSVEYGKFQIVEENRAIDWDHVERLYDAIEAKNLLREYPILVTPKYEVIDGQHRLKAAEALGVAIYYIVSTEASVKDVAMTNAMTRRWSLQDYMNWYVRERRPQYVALQEFLNTYPFLNLNAAAKLCFYGDQSSLSPAFKSGKYACNDLPFGHRAAKALLDFKVYVPFYKDRVFVLAVSNLVANADYDHRRMMGKMEGLSTKLVKCPDMDSYFERFTEIYNYGHTAKTRVTLQKLASNDVKYRVDRKRDF